MSSILLVDKFAKIKGTLKSVAAGLLICVAFVSSSKAETITLAVGHDHQKMLDRKYDIYRANWEFIEKSLTELGHTLTASPLPWARAKAQVQAGTLDGLFIAAKFTDREKWAAFSYPIGYEIYGAFELKNNDNASNIAAAVRLGGMDRTLSNIPPDKLLYVPTAQQGLKLLVDKKVGSFIMAQGYGQYLLDNELQHLAKDIWFNDANSESQSLHIAVSKKHAHSLAKLAILDKAIKYGIAKGYYQQALDKYNVPMQMRY